MFELGSKATEILIRNIESSKPLQIENVEFEAEFIMRQSTKALQSIHTSQREENFQTVS
jgi:DNA-binding LacI/PurR family transcriptional regulator